MLVIDDESLTENEIRTHLEAFVGNINCFIFVNGQAPSSPWAVARGWDVKSSGVWAEWSRNYEDVWRKADFKNHRKSYETLERLSRMLVGSISVLTSTQWITTIAWLAIFLMGVRYSQAVPKYALMSITSGLLSELCAPTASHTSGPLPAASQSKCHP